MSLYSAIDVPKNERQRSARREGFVGLYGDVAASDGQSSTLAADRAASPTEEKSVSDAVLQFAPITRRRPVVPAKRKVTASEDVNRDSIAPEIQNDSQEGIVTDAATKNVPRLEVINNFEDYAEYTPELAAAISDRPKNEGRRKNRKAKAAAMLAEPLSWDDEYDPSRPVDLEDYLHSEERIAAREDWQAYKHRNGLVQAKSPEKAPAVIATRDQKVKLNFGPPGRGKLNFAPALSSAVHVVPGQTPTATTASLPSPPPPPEPRHAELPITAQHDPPQPSAETAEEAYQRRVAMQQDTFEARRSHDPPSESGSDRKWPAKSLGPPGTYIPAPPPPRPRVEYSAAPTFNTANPAEPGRASFVEGQVDEELEAAEQQVDRGNAPGQKGFAQRYMASQGWTKGQGLGSSGSGRLAPLFVKPQKDGKSGKIIDRHARHVPNGPSMSRVVLLTGMIDSKDAFDEFLQQDIGDSCSEAYGKVERVKLVMESGRVLVKFTDAISALRCVSTVEGREYRGKHISARYYREDDFERGDWTR